MSTYEISFRDKSRPALKVEADRCEARGGFLCFFKEDSTEEPLAQVCADAVLCFTKDPEVDH